jgi:hypothetical protein
VLLAPEVFAIRADTPNAELLLPVLTFNASRPIAVLDAPVKFEDSAK